VTAAERTLLLALFRWARTEGGLEYGGLYTWARRGFHEPEKRWGITFDPTEWTEGGPVELEIWRARITMKSYWVASIAEAVDMLAAIGIAPARFSTAYRAGYEARRQASHQARMHGWDWPVVQALIPATDRELAVRR
jgi:hypothetical protein